ncbi:MAG: peptidylprolyl isomerase [Planctomycetota bacterium]|jgi:peptidyl-prolyl cis-trans isomerase C
MKNLTIICTLLFMAMTSLLVADNCATEKPGTCTVKDGKVVCNKDAKACDKEAACTKDCNKCPSKETCTKTCSKKDAAACDKKDTCAKACAAKDAAKKCPADCTKACCAAAITVNGVKITNAEIAAELDKRVAAQANRMPPGQQMPDAYKQQMRQRIVDMKVEQILMEQEMKKKDLTVTDKDVMDEIAKIAAAQGQTMEQVKAQIAGFGMTMDDLKEQVGYQVKQKALMKAELKDGADVKDEDVKKFYDDNPQYFDKPHQVKASHILCGKRGITEAEFPAELEKIKEAQAKLKKGEKFEDVAKEMSTCPSSAQGGDLGFFGKGQMDPAFEKAAFETEPGETTDIVKTSFGYHIIKVTDKNEAGKVPMAEVQEKIKGHLENQKQQEFWTGYNAGMKEAAKIEYSDAEKAKQEESKAAQQAMMQQQMMRQMQAQQAAPAPQPKP